MNHEMMFVAARSLALCSLLTGAGVAHAQTSEQAPATEAVQTAAAALPDGFELFEKFIDVVGGKATLDKIETMRINGLVPIPGMGEADLLIEMAAPAKMAVVVELPNNFGVIEQGTDGDVAWQSAMPNAPAQVVEGPQADMLKGQARFRDEYQPRKTYASAKTLGKETFEGAEVYRVELTRNDDGTVSNGLFSVETGLRVADLLKTTPEAATFDMTVKIGDYREVKMGDEGTVLVAHEIVSSSPMGSQTITFTNVQINPEIEDGTFDPPGSF